MFKWIANRCFFRRDLVGFIFYWSYHGWMAFDASTKLGTYTTEEAAKQAVEASVVPPQPQMCLALRKAA